MTDKEFYFEKPANALAMADMCKVDTDKYRDDRIRMLLDYARLLKVQRKLVLDNAHNIIVIANTMDDPDYCPYCMRCSELVRMRKVEQFLWKHDCGAVHDERQALLALRKEDAS